MKKIDKDRAQNFQKLLDRFPFVKWDRVADMAYFPSVNCSRYYIYGWIDREKDQKDFVVFNIFGEKDDFRVEEFITSSAKYTKEINKLCGFRESEHHDCIKVSDLVSKILVNKTYGSNHNGNKESSK